MRPVLLAVLGVAACGAIGSAVLAADDPLQTAITARQSFMRVVAFNIGPLGAMAKGQMDYDADKASAFAGNLHALSQMEFGAMWPEGSSNDNPAYAKKTNALPAVWSNMAEVGKRHQAWTDAAAELAAVAGDGLDAVKAKIGPVGQACSGCHDNFRAKLN